jgi:hypothetical protein
VVSRYFEDTAVFLSLWILMSMATVAIWGTLCWVVISILRHWHSHDKTIEVGTIDRAPGTRSPPMGAEGCGGGPDKDWRLSAPDRWLWARVVE